jgi:hypothetical protein
MKVVSSGNKYEIYSDQLKTYDELPAQVYKVHFNPMTGFSLLATDEIHVTEKVYGMSNAKVEKTLIRFEQFERNLGVLLSGPKGIGKSLFTKSLAEACVNHGYPVVIVNEDNDGLTDFIDSIKQKVVVVFDEFDKVFSMERQDQMLSLFDGISQGKKMYIITCNELRKISNYIVNRPGRFHFHYRFDYPTVDEVKEYLHDNLSEEYYDQINAVANFSSKVSVNYDCLRSICVELETGLSFEEAIKDLNIVNLETERYDLLCCFKSGRTHMFKNRYLDLFGDDMFFNEYEDINDDGDLYVYYQFYTKNIKFDTYTGSSYVDGNDVTYKFVDDRNKEEKEKCPLEQVKKDPNYIIDKIIISRKVEKGIHYAL